MTDSWWSQRLGNAPVAPARPAVPLYPGQGQQPQPQAYRTPNAPGQQPQEGYQPQQFYSYNENGQQVPDDGHVAVLHAAALQTGGSAKMKAANGHCPECNSSNYFAITTSENGMALRLPPAPRCMDCGFPLIQAGSHHGGANMASTRGSGPPQRARQTPDHDVHVVDPQTNQEIIFPAGRRR